MDKNCVRKYGMDFQAPKGMFIYWKKYFKNILAKVWEHLPIAAGHGKKCINNKNDAAIIKPTF